MQYKPEPIDTSRIDIPEELLPLTEMLAENTHEIWASGRLAGGWTWGPARDDLNKRHPDLVPYRDLPEAEKEFDRKTSQETIKAILSLGYHIHY